MSESLAVSNREPSVIGKATLSVQSTLERLFLRKGGRGTTATGIPLFRRLNEHAKSISEAANLDLDDFYCRYLVVKDIWIPLGESLLIELKQPLWNVIIDGFGNHDPGAGRIQGRSSLWDTIHPGRRWAAKFPPNEQSADEVLETIRRSLAGEAVQKLSEHEQNAESESDKQ